ncbi:ribonuclease-III-like-domain-containing protein [Mycotypha africana]|uniref:ribonuclease-III-like-domain-containing protein n=1 Tax=Mycotypha africana TaxID=64632 RepID=UPI0023013860|nr:ribonuclease-III-like-domain-containing protein [Mycotypha africana]KAI8981691.1 ribonuclease-III-like-domain-containing protein [Mycotypha africana]
MYKSASLRKVAGSFNKQPLLIQTCRRQLHRNAILQQELSMSPSFKLEEKAAELSLRPATLKQALTHKSFKHGTVPTNERIQLIGYRAIQFFATEKIAKDPTNNQESQTMIKSIRELVNFKSNPFETLGLQEGFQGELPTKEIPHSVKCTTLQAITGAIYHERGINAARDFVHKHIFPPSN